VARGRAARRAVARTRCSSGAPRFARLGQK
jgi:hypothetical protein